MVRLYLLEKRREIPWKYQIRDFDWIGRRRFINNNNKNKKEIGHEFFEICCIIWLYS